MMERQVTTKSERDYAKNIKFAEALIGPEKGLFGRFKSNEGTFTEQEVLDAIVRCHGRDISMDEARNKMGQYVGNETYGNSIRLKELALLKNDTLRIDHVKMNEREIKYRAYYYSRDPRIC